MKRTLVMLALVAVGLVGSISARPTQAAPAATNTTYAWHNLQPGTYWVDCHGGDASVSWWLGHEVMVWCNNAALTGNPYVYATTLRLYRGDSGRLRGVLYTRFTRVEDLGRTIKVVLSR